MSAQVRPTEVRHQREPGLVRITWSDGHSSDYPYAYLRGWCPCAVCQGHGGERRFLNIADPKLAAIAAVGNYALRFTWEGGHDTGIYAYRYLRELCPCPACAAGS
ncbi:MAG: DUF971 domain-containing protein [Deltaproteobacteria bacterium]|nr:DUF971 domain-containing protein [Deltaproteobacteria bacterium]